MQCPKCKCDKNTAIDTRKYITLISRVRLCEECQYIWSTKETLDEVFNHKGFQKKARSQEEDQEGLFKE